MRKTVLYFCGNREHVLAQIAVKCGYRSSSHLRKMFERRTKMTMGEWRERHAEGNG